MRQITLEELLEAGCHFGHQTTRQNPKARDYVFEARDNIHIIDLAKTKEELERAGAFVRDLAKKGGTIIVLGAKRQADTVVKEEVKRVQEAGVDGMYWVTARWIGGILTNFPEVSKNFKRLELLSGNLGNPQERAKFTKKEVSLWEKELGKLEVFYGGVKTMSKIPDAVFVIDTHLENLAVREARATGVVTVGITDTNADPTVIDYPIPANDDAVGSIKLITSYLVDAWIEGRKTKAQDDVERSEISKKETKAQETSKPEKKEKKAEKKETETVKTEPTEAKPAAKAKTTKKKTAEKA